MHTVIKDAFSAFKKPFVWIAIIAIPIIVACFGLLYFGTFISPDERLKDLPIAVINKDKGATVDDQTYTYGADLANSITETDKAKWQIEDASLLDEGLENTDYFLAIIIPEDFSERVSAGQTQEPTQANITFYKNVRKNYMLSTLSSRIESSLKELVNQSITEQYSKAYVDGLISAKDGYNSAAEGADSLTNGLTTLEDGSNTLSSGIRSASSGAQSLTSGLEQLSSGAQSLEEGGTTLTSSSAQISQGLSSLSNGSNTFNNTLVECQSAIASQYGGDPSSAIPALQEQYTQALKNYATNVVIATKTGQDPSQVSTEELQQTLSALTTTAGATGAYSTLDQTISGYSSIHDGIQSLSSVYGTFDSGLNTYTSSTGQLSSGLSSAQTGATSLSSGASQLESGASSLSSGITSAKDGSSTLSSSLSEGADTIDSSVTASSDDIAEYMSEPVSVNEETYGNLDKFGYGFAPLFLTLSIWLGSLIIFFLFDPFPTKKNLGASRFAVIFGRWPLYFIVGLLEVAIVLTGAFYLGLPCTNTALLIVFFLVMSFSFICIMQFFNFFDVIGKAIAVLFVIVQLVFCSGTFPAQLGNDIATAVGPCLPFYYAIDGIRELMSGGVEANVFNDMGTILLFGLGGLALSLISYPLALKKKKQRNAEMLEELSAEAVEATPA